MRTVAALASVAIVIGYGVYLAYRQVEQARNGCQANSGAAAVRLDPEQGAIAATIAGVAHDHRLVTHAVTIAYATAMQESHLHNLTSGDLDSIGIFQQRPSQGWGSPQQLRDPVYATSAFFNALVKVPGYLHLPVEVAAQDVQHSADGSAYGNYQRQATGMAVAFTGQRPHAVWCWFTPHRSGKPAIAAARHGLLHTFGRLDVRLAGDPRGMDPAADVRVGHRPVGWAVAGWLVTHAAEYQLSSVRYAGYQWSISAGNRGWTSDPSALGGSVELR
jgi:hypothetical protein